MEFSVNGMKCVGCEKVIEEGLSKEKGIHKVKADFPSATLFVTYDAGATSVDKIKRAVSGLGYELTEFAASPVAANPTAHAKAEFSVRGMKCEGCETLIGEGLLKERGVQSAKANFANATLSVSYDPSLTSSEKIRRTAEHLGYGLVEKPLHPISAAARSSHTVTDANNSARHAGSDQSPQKAGGSGRTEEEEGLEDEDEETDASGGSSSGPGWFKPREIFNILIILVIFGLAYVVISRLEGGFSFPAPGSNVALTAIFAVGLFTGIHCVGMCGGFVASAAKGAPGALPRYFGGKLISYTVIGGLLGLIGASILIGQDVRAALAIAAGVFMVVFGLSALGISFFRQLYASIPKLRIPVKYASHGPFVLGLLNGLMPCGPLMAMEVYALSTGSLVSGALAMFVFGVGTMPLMAGFGAILTRLGSYSAAISRASSFVVIFLGVSLLLNGWVVFADKLAVPSQPQLIVAQNSGTTAPPSQQTNLPSGAIAAAGTGSAGSAPQPSAPTAQGSGGEQTITFSVMSYGYQPSVIYAKPNTKTKLVVDAKELNGCNHQLRIPSLGVLATLQNGENDFEFTTGPDGSNIDFSCGMGMLKGRIVVAGSPGTAKAAAAAAPRGGSCGGSGGGCGCGG